MREIFRYLKPHLPRMTVGFLFKFTGTIVELIIPMILSYIVDEVVPTGDIVQVYWWGGAMLLCAVLALVNNIVANRMASAVARDTTRAVRHDLFAKISWLSSRQIDAFSIPSLESRLTTDTYNVNQVIGMMQRLGVRAPILLVGGVLVTMSMEPVLTLVMVAVMPFIGLVEPLRGLFKDEVRNAGRELGIPEYLVSRQPFPGPGLGIRIIGEVTEEKIKIVQEADYIYREEIAKAGLDKNLGQYFAALTNMRSVGVMGDFRTYDYAIALRAVETSDFMTATAAQIPWDVLNTITNRIVNEVKGVNRVMYDCTSKPPGTIEFE